MSGESFMGVKDGDGVSGWNASIQHWRQMSFTLEQVAQSVYPELILPHGVQFPLP